MVAEKKWTKGEHVEEEEVLPALTAAAKHRPNRTTRPAVETQKKKKKKKKHKPEFSFSSPGVEGPTTF